MDPVHAGLHQNESLLMKKQSIPRVFVETFALVWYISVPFDLCQPLQKLVPFSRPQIYTIRALLSSIHSHCILLYALGVGLRICMVSRSSRSFLVVSISLIIGERYG